MRNSALECRTAIDLTREGPAFFSDMGIGVARLQRNNLRPPK
jgi:hypothetical protein